MLNRVDLILGVPAVEIFPQSLVVVVYQIDISGHELVHCEDTSLLVFGELAAEVIGGSGLVRRYRLGTKWHLKRSGLASGPGGGLRVRLPAARPGASRSNTSFRSNIDAWPAATLPSARADVAINCALVAGCSVGPSRALVGIRKGLPGRQEKRSGGTNLSLSRTARAQVAIRVPTLAVVEN